MKIYPYLKWFSISAGWNCSSQTLHLIRLTANDPISLLTSSPSSASASKLVHGRIPWVFLKWSERVFAFA